MQQFHHSSKQRATQIGNHIADFTFLNALAIEIKLGVVWTFAKIIPVKYHESWYILYLITHQATMKLGYINGIRYQL